MKIPPSPALSVKEALKTFRLQPGFDIEVVASEPMIQAPVEIEFDPEGRIFVLEMRDFMPSVDGKGEDNRTGRVMLLSDPNYDGRMDKSTVFVDGLLMPRAIACVRGGLLVAEPPTLWFLRDTDGDGKADRKEVVSSDYGNQSNPEHAANGLLWGRDNWIYSANHTVRYRHLGSRWENEGTVFRGQWGISQDDLGRLFFNSNADQLRGDFVPARYLSRNPNFKTAFGANVRIANDQTTFPVRINPGVNRGYQSGTLKPDGTLARFTAACGPLIYRGDLFPKQFYGAAFLCEPAGNFVRCNFLDEKDGLITATNASPNAEFLASTDERFRPVNLFNGPDGALYVVDMYRGVIQHRLYVTSFLRKQVLDRRLETPLNYGRIYRVIPTKTKRPPARNLARLSASGLVTELDSPNGWVRDTAQQLLVERRDFVALPILERLAGKGAFPSAIHALWVMHGLNALNSESILAALNSTDPKVRATAVRVSEPLAQTDDPLAERIFLHAKDPSADVRLQVMFSLGEVKTERAERAMLDLLHQDSEHPLIRDAAITGLKGRELAFLARTLAHPGWSEKAPGREEVIRNLARCVAESRDPSGVNELLEIAAGQNLRWIQYDILDGIAALIPRKGRSKEAPAPKPLRLAGEPLALAKLTAAKDDGLNKRLKLLEPLLAWPEKAGLTSVQAAPLTEVEKELFEAGKVQYPLICGACHQPTGLGLDGLAPSLIDTDWTTGSPERLARIVLNGVRGPLNVKGKVWELDMPPVHILSDKEIASLLTYIRREWGHTASAIHPDFIARVRRDTAEREEAWTEEELLKIP